MADHDYSDWLASFAARPSSAWNLTVPVSWRVLAVFSDDLDARILADARGAGAAVWSEDRDEQRIYHVSGTGVQLTPVIATLQSDLNQPMTSEPITGTGSNRLMSSFHSQLLSRCARSDVVADVTVYPGFMRSSVVAVLRGGAGAVVDVLGDLEIAIARHQGRRTPRAPQPARSPVPQRRGPELGLTA